MRHRLPVSVDLDRTAACLEIVMRRTVREICPVEVERKHDRHRLALLAVQLLDGRRDILM